VGPRAPIHSSPFGPFVNRAHFAGLMVIVVPAALAFVFGVNRHRRQRRSGRRWADVLREWSTETDARRLMPVFIVVMGGAALLSGSRGGLVALTVAIFMMLGGLWAQGQPGRGGVGRVGLAALLIVLTAVWIGSDILYGTLERLAEEVEQPAESLRIRIWADAFNLWRAAPLFGAGFATFEFAFPRFRTVQAPVVFSHAESDWIQLLTDTGLVGFGLVVALVVCLASALRRRYRTAESRWTRALGLAGLVALAATIIHGAANYNIPVMANFLYLALVLALAHP
jgi:O-antigen ligase